MQRMQMRMKLPLKHDNRYAKLLTGLRKLLSQKGPPWVFDGVLSTHLVSLVINIKGGKVLRVDPLHKKGLKFLVYFF